MRAALLAFLVVALVLSPSARGQEPAGATVLRGPQPDVRLVPTAHPSLPASFDEYWVLPSSATPTAAAEQFGTGVALLAKNDFANALPLVSAPELSTSPLAAYSARYTAVALAGLGRIPDALAVLEAALDSDLSGYMEEALPLEASRLASMAGDHERAFALVKDLRGETLLGPEDVWLQVGVAAEGAGDIDAALEAYRTVYYDYATSTQAAVAQEGIDRLQTPDRIPPDRYRRELERAEALFRASRWAQARAAFESLTKVAPEDDRSRIGLRLAQCDFHLNRYRPARDALRPYLNAGSRQAEARYYYLRAVRALGDRATYVKLVRELVRDHADSSWSAEALDGLASHYITVDEDEAADGVFRELLEKFPRHPHAERAAWKVGWLAYRMGNYQEAAETFEQAAARFPRADYRPSWLYWSGRAWVQLGDLSRAADRFAVTIADYQNSYYGRLAARAVESHDDIILRAVATTGAQSVEIDPLPSEALIRELMSLGLYDDALREVRYAQRVWGDSPRLQATVALIRHNQGLGLTGQERFAALRGAINTMRRAYPQFMAAGGENLPPEVLRIIFPLDYWPLITKYASAHELDPYLLAALMAQESTFTAEIRSSANAIGLMQIIPSTGRRLATRLGVRNFSTRSLTQPELNVRLGTRYFKDLMVQFGEAHYALAGYNAGEHRVVRWLAERGPLPADEFIDDIPFPETQLYVKRILGTTEDYRRLYGTGLLDPNMPLAASAAIGITATPLIR